MLSVTTQPAPAMTAAMASSQEAMRGGSLRPADGAASAKTRLTANGVKRAIRTCSVLSVSAQQLFQQQFVFGGEFRDESGENRSAVAAFLQQLAHPGGRVSRLIA